MNTLMSHDSLAAFHSEITIFEPLEPSYCTYRNICDKNALLVIDKKIY